MQLRFRVRLPLSNHQLHEHLCHLPAEPAVPARHRVHDGDP